MLILAFQTNIASTFKKFHFFSDFKALHAGRTRVGATLPCGIVLWPRLQYKMASGVDFAATISTYSAEGSKIQKKVKFRESMFASVCLKDKD